MKKYKSKILKTIICSIFLLIISCIANNTFGYQIKHVLTPIENPNPEKIEYMYRKQVAAYSDTIKKWNNNTYVKSADGWAYVTANAINNSTYESKSNFPNNYTHTDANSFVRMYEYFHRNQNSSYTTTADGTTNIKRYYSTGTVSSTSSPQKSNLSYKQFWNVWRESDYYDGVYQNESDIVKISSNLYRFAIVDGIYVSDNIIDYQTILQIYNKFKDTNLNGKTLTVYQSSVLRTNSANGGYYQNIDTSWKAWETLIRGKRGWAWNESPSTTGYKNGKINADMNIINYFDNTFEIPIPDITKNIVVRHIDVTGIENINSNTVKSQGKVINVTANATKAFQHDENNWIKFDNEKIQYPNYINNTVVATGEKYSENYIKKDMSMHLRIGNLKYKYTDYSEPNTPKTYQTLDTTKTLSDKEKDILYNYNCIGAVVGKGETFNQATDNRNVKLNSVDIRTASDDNASYLETTSGIIKLSDMTSVLVKGDEASPCIIIDFYYEKTDPYTTNNTKKVYVRHVDVSKVDEVSSNNIDAADRLTGLGYLHPDPFSSNNKIYKDSAAAAGYQETYTLASSIVSGSIPKDSNKNYSCIGYNLVKTDDSKLTTAKNKLDYKLDESSEKYEYMGGDTVEFDFSDGSDVIIVDFYYMNKNTGDALKRPEVGRLSFYTVGDTERFSSLNSIDVRRTNNNNQYYDIIPSNETLKMSIDNAYTYMLGAINITEQKITEKTFEFTYEIIQEYTVKYYDWSAKCSGQCDGTSDDKVEEGACEDTYESTCYEDGESFACYKDCTGTWSNTQTLVENNYAKTVMFTYSIPYDYTFYKVKNMRFYTISKIELYDAYNNAGLPLFDGEKHTVYPVNNYTNSFKEESEFVGSESGQTVNRKDSNLSNGDYSWDQSKYTYTLSKDLTYTYNNDWGDVAYSDEAKDYADDNVDALLAGIDEIDATEIDKLDVTSTKDYDIANDGKSYSTKYSLNEDEIVRFNENDRLHAIFYVKNDEVSFTDKVKGKDVKLVGEGSSYKTRKPSEGDIADEMNAIRFVDLYEYTKDNSSEKAEVSVDYPTSIRDVKTNDAVGSKYLPSNSLTTEAYFEDDAFEIPEERLNGKYYSYGKIYYNLLSNNNNLNFDVSDEEVKDEDDKHNWTRKTVSGPMGNTFVDTEMYNTELSKPTDKTKTTLIKPGMLTEVVWEYGEHNRSSQDVDIVDIFTPILFTTNLIGKSVNDRLVDHTIDGVSETNDEIIQKNSRFTVEMNTGVNSTYSGINTMKYLGQYYIKFDFDVQDIIIDDAKGENRNYASNYVSSNEWIGPIYNKYGTIYDGTVSISAYALEDPELAQDVVNQESNSYEVRAVAANAPDSLLYDVSRDLIEDTTTFITKGKNNFSTTSSNNQLHQKYYNLDTIYGHSNYVAKQSVTTENISRLYDFKVTDVKDLDWKNIFRKSSTTTTNVHSGKAYYSGINKWDIYTTDYNKLEQRDVSEIGATNQQILPVGPYKHTTSTYTSAPKLGYRFSFDLKTTGANENKKVVITPSYYYLSKDGTIFEEDIKLYYKNSSNKYIDISNYNLYFVPDDGYRLSFKETDYRFESSLLKDVSVSLLENIDSQKRIVLTDDMKQQTDNGFIQIWYGEYKLPNSTIAVKGEDGKYDLNKNRLTSGYIGIKFDIKVYEYGSKSDLKSGESPTRVLSYSQNDQNASNKTNTSQWDYEGYLGFSSPGTAASNLKLYLEKGTLTIDNDMYNKLKGTVMLYDTDARASEDYE